MAENVDYHEMMLALAHALKKDKGAHIAIMSPNDRSWPTRAAKDTTTLHRPATGTAIVNLLQAYPDDVRKVAIYSTYAPTEACKGMSRMMTGGGGLFYISGGAVKCWFADRNTPGPSSVPDWGTVYSNPPPSGWKTDPAGKATALSSWASGLRRGRRDWDSTSSATRVNGLTISTGRPAIPLTEFPTPSTGITLEVVKQCTTTDDKDEFMMLLTYELVRQAAGRRVLGSRLYGGMKFLDELGTTSSDHKGHNIGGILVDKNYKILSWAVNTNQENKSRHGEINLLQALERHGGGIPQDASFFSTLEPCEMCSGMIQHCTGGRTGVRVIYGQKDDGLGDTALRSSVSVTMSASKAKATGSGKTLPTRISEAQTSSERRDRSMKATTKYLYTTTAMDLFMDAKRERERLTKPLAETLGSSIVHEERESIRKTQSVTARRERGLAILDELSSHRSKRSGSQLRKLGIGIRDDSALLDLRRHKQRAEMTRGYTSFDRYDLGSHISRPIPVDPRLLELDSFLEKLGETFRARLLALVKEASKVRYEQEVPRLLKQVKKFIDDAVTAVVS